MVGNIIALYLVSVSFSSEMVYVTKVGEQTRVSVSHHSGRFIVVYEDTNCGKPEKHICMNFGGSEELADDSFVSTAFPSVGVDSNGNIYVVWSDARAIDPSSGQRTWDIYLRKKVGNVWQPSQRIHPKTSSDQCGTSGDQINPDIFVSSSGIYIVWQSIDSSGRSSICFVHSPDFGSTWNPNKRLAEGYVPAIAVYGSNVYIVFSDINGNVRFLSSNDGGNSFSLRADPIYNAKKRIPDLSSPDIGVSPTGNIIVVLQDKIEKLGTEDIDVILVSSRDGGKSWSSPSNLALPGDQVTPSVTFAGGIFIFYNQTKSETLGPDIYYVEARGNVSVSRGELSPSGSIEVISGVKNIPIFQMKVTSSPELGEAEIKTVRFRSTGTFDDRTHIAKVKLLHDTDGNGTVTSPDTILAESVFPDDNAYVSLPVNRLVSSEPIYLLLVVDLSSPIPRGSNFSVTLEPAVDVLATLPSSSIGVPVTGPILSSAVLRVRNNLPVVKVSADHSSVLENSGRSVLLDASGTYDPDGDVMSFSWKQVGGPPVDLRISGSTASFVAPSSVTRNEKLVFEVTVVDSFGGMSTGTVSVLVVDSINEPPVAKARVRIGNALFGGVVEVSEGSIVILDASESYDPNHDPLFYFWTKLFGPDITIHNPSGVTSYFRTPDVVGSPYETIVVNLSTRDSKGSTSSDRIEIRIRNTRDDPPVAIFSAVPPRGAVPLSVTFDASRSFDHDGFIVLYSWDFGDGVVIDTTSPLITHTYAKPGEYRITLRVRDSAGNVSSFSSVVTVLSSVPAVFLSPTLLEPRPSFGVSKNVLSLKVSNISQEDIFLNSLSLNLKGVPNALFEFFVDDNEDGTVDRRVQSFLLSTTSSSFLSVTLNTTLYQGDSLTIYLSAVLNPFDVPAKYELTVLGVLARGALTGGEPDIYGISLPYRVEFGVYKAALVFSSRSTFVVITEDRSAFTVDVSANGGDFTISALLLEYDPTKISRIVIFNDLNQNETFDRSDVLIGDLSGGEQRINLHMNISRETKRKIGFLFHLVPYVKAPTYVSHNDTYINVSLRSLHLIALFFVFFALIRGRSNFFVLLAFVVFLSQLLTCANNPGKPLAVKDETEQKVGDSKDKAEDRVDKDADLSKYRIYSKFTIAGVELSRAPSEHDVVGLPLQIWLVH